MKLERRYVEKPWGRTSLPPMFDPPEKQRIGEVWFEGAGDLPLLAKYIFTSEALSIQVHPNDEQAHERGLPSGKSECWYILDAEPGSSIAFGLKREVSAEKLRAAALNGSIEDLVVHREVAAGDFISVPGGTIHAIGAGISLLEFQQNADITYRLYDYGRPRELHLDDGIAVASRGPPPDGLIQRNPSETTLIDGPFFALRLARSDAFQDRQRWVMPLEGGNAGQCFLLDPGEEGDVGEELKLVGAKA